MKSPALLLSWLAVPIAGMAGFCAKRQLSASPGLPAPVVREQGTSKPDGREASPAEGGVRSWAARLRKCQVADLPGLYAEIGPMQGKDAMRNRMALRLLCARWAELDPAGGLAFLSHPGDKGNGFQSRNWLLAEWALLDQEAALAAIQGLPGKQALADLENVGREILLEGGEKFWAWFQKTKKPPFTSWGSSPETKNLVAAHFEELSAMAGDLVKAAGPDLKANSFEQQQLAEFYGLLASSLAEKDPDKALEWAKSQPEIIRNETLTGALGVMVARNPEKIVDYLGLLKARQIGSNSFVDSGGPGLVRSAIAGMTARDPLGTVDWLGANLGKLGQAQTEALGQLSRGLSAAMSEGGITPEQAFKSLNRFKGDSDFRLPYVFHNLWQDLPEDQLASTASWLGAMTGEESGESRHDALRGVMVAWSAQNPEAASKFTLGLGDPALAAEVFTAVDRAQGMGGDLLRQREQLAALSQIPPEFRAGVLATRLGDYAGAGPWTAPPFEGAEMARLLEGLPDSDDTRKASVKLAEAWAELDPQSAIAWSAARQDPALREKTSGAVVEAWAKADAFGASQWIDALPEGGERDMAAHHLARVLRTEEPESAWTWAGSISDPDIRLEAQSAVLRKWRDSSAAEARAAVEAMAADLPSEARRKLVDTLEHRDGAK